MHVGEGRAGLGGGETCRLGVPDGGVDLALGGAEATGDRHGAGDVGGVEGVGLDAGVHQQQIAAVDVAVVADPVQGVGVVAAGGDGVVAHGIAQMAGVQTEDALHPPLAAALAHRGGKFRHDRLESLGRVRAGASQLGEFEVVLDQAGFGQCHGELGIGGVGAFQFHTGL